jgi:Ca2+/Na+ antiporter
MRPVDVLLGVLFPIFIAVGMMAMGASSPTEFWVAKIGFCLAALDAVALSMWWLYKSDPGVWQYTTALTIVLLATVFLAFTWKWVDEKEAVSEIKVPKNSGILRANSELILSGTENKSNRLLEVGDSGAIFVIHGGPLLPFLGGANIMLELVDDQLKVSCRITDDNGNLVAELIRNEWKVAPPPQSWDRNYTKDALEVKDSKGRIVLQVKVLPDRIQLQGEWWSNKSHGIRLVKSADPKFHGAVMSVFNDKIKDFSPEIEPMFEYPSDTHFGELRKTAGSAH